MSLLLHCGAKSSTLEELRDVKIPEPTKTYRPVGHYEFANMLKDMASSVLPTFTYASSQYGLARNGDQLFGVHTFNNSHTKLGLSIGFRNSFDRSLAAAIAVGATVFCCDNLCLSGDITAMRKHTLNVKQDLETLAIMAILKSRSAYYQVREDADKMQEIGLNNDEAYKLIGLLYGHGVITPRQVPVVKREWLSPSHEEFQPRSIWSLYNAATEALKSSPPRTIMEKHLQLHHMITQTDPVYKSYAL